MKSHAGITPEELPFKLENELERNIATDPEWLEGLKWGKPRPGHPEGKVVAHIVEVLINIDRFFDSNGNRQNLRLIGLIHDTFKYKAGYRKPGGYKEPHGYLARKFAERYINDPGILEVIELHDEAYKVSLLLTQRGEREAAERRAKELIERLGDNLDLFMQFYLCDSRTGDKSTTHYEWFKRQISN